MPPAAEIKLANAATTTIIPAIQSGNIYQFAMMAVARISESAMIFGGIPPFVPQYLQLKKSGNVEGFSLYVCFTLIMANVLRIAFWTQKHFETPLLMQSFVMITTMLFLVHAYVNAKTKLVGADRKLESPLQALFDKDQFWQWHDYSSYIFCVSGISVIVGLMTFILQSSFMYTEVLGFCSVFVEACLGLPQFIRNFKNHSTTGMSVMMVLMWTSGDTFKFFYFLLRDAPIQFSFCAMLQIILDISILAQVVYYSSLAKPISKILPSQYTSLRHTVE